MDISHVETLPIALHIDRQCNS